jgi:hypothetical protein
MVGIAGAAGGRTAGVAVIVGEVDAVDVTEGVVVADGKGVPVLVAVTVGVGDGSGVPVDVAVDVSDGSVAVGVAVEVGVSALPTP